MFNLKNQKGTPSSILGTLPVIVLVFIFLMTAGSLLLRHTITKKLAYLSSQLDIPPDTGEINDILLDLNGAENVFQQASLYGYSDKLEEYTTKLTSILNRIEQLVQQNPTDSVPGERGVFFRKNFDGKVEISTKIFDLKKSFDSLLNITTADALYDRPVLPRSRQLQPQDPLEISTTNRDTIVHQTEVNTERKGFFKRIRDAIVNKPDSQVTTVIEVTRENNIRDSITRATRLQAEESQKALIEQLSRKHRQLTEYQLSLLSANRSLITQLRHLIDELRTAYLKEWQSSRNDMFRQYKASVNNLNTFTLVAILMVMIFIVLLYFSIRKSNHAERQLRAENARAIALAEQKSELLAVMSHEIRNPLTALTGYIYILDKTELSPKQRLMVTPMKQASALLQETVNDILDMSKFESLQAAALKRVPFLPDKVLRETVSNMQGGADKKGISLSYLFEGPEKLEVIGDSFRLKQLLINLISNAMKYTDQGGVTIKATLSVNSDQARLQVSVTDTGTGMSAEQLERLFTKYYQADNAVNKPGTGLGLYICAQLIQLQNGSIRAESESGKGSVFSFTIPYTVSAQN